MNESEFNRLLKKYEKGLATEKEKRMLEQWADSMKRYDTNAPFTDEDNDRLLNKTLARLDAQEAAQQKPETPTRTLYATVRIAAAVAVFLTASFVIWQWQAVEIINVATLAETQKVILPDGSIIWLKENSTLSYPDRFKGETRNISFNGEALFEIAKDKDHPFIIESGALTATVLGTSFNIKTTQQDIEVTVLTGRVALESAVTGTLVVNAHEKAVYNAAEKQLAQIAPQPDEAVRLIAGTEYDMNFKDTRMNSIIQRIEKKFNVTVTLDGDGINNCMVTADLTDQSLTETLSIIAESLGIAFDIERKHVTLSGKGCD